jgi:hypothetical protein
MPKSFLFLISAILFLVASSVLPAMRLPFIVLALALAVLSAVLLIKRVRNKQ